MDSNGWGDASNVYQDVSRVRMVRGEGIYLYDEPGQVNRESGLRGRGRKTLRALATGAVANARIQSCDSLGNQGELLTEASLVVQATGALGNSWHESGPPQGVEWFGRQPNAWSPSPTALG